MAIYTRNRAKRRRKQEAQRREFEAVLAERCLPPHIASRLADRLIRPCLSPREMDVLRLACRGRSNKEMAAAMFLSEETVKSHMKSLFVKLNVHDRTEAVAVAFQRGLIRL